jgi:hypothetical protein
MFPNPIVDGTMRVGLWSWLSHQSHGTIWLSSDQPAATNLVEKPFYSTLSCCEFNWVVKYMQIGGTYSRREWVCSICVISKYSYVLNTLTRVNKSDALSHIGCVGNSDDEE